jgi:hypothetical protein
MNYNAVFGESELVIVNFYFVGQVSEILATIVLPI